MSNIDSVSNMLSHRFIDVVLIDLIDRFIYKTFFYHTKRSVK